MDGVFCQLATFDRTQPEGLALATARSRGARPSPRRRPSSGAGRVIGAARAALRALRAGRGAPRRRRRPAAATNPLRDDADDDDVEILGDAEEGDDKDDDGAAPGRRDDKGRSDGAVFLAFAINGSLVACFLGACLAARDRAPLGVRPGERAVMGFAFSVVARRRGGGLRLRGRPRSAAPCVAIALAAAVIRGLDGYCTPLFYREIHAVSGSIAVLQWSGILAIWVVNGRL
ncbi:hypothetical protein SO694_00069124 [Aureococcus anophagefferens]|uniref:Uncharacterized protein n=1 Tax=Aureococcus anophagefferens TaxID=44056 RepID=A0ABR1FQ32_AURAN